MNSNEEISQDEMKQFRKMGRRHFWKFPVIFAGIVLIKGGAVMLLWNALIPDLFHGPIVNFGQAIGLVVLAKLLVGFKGMHHFGGHRGFGGRGGWGGRGGHRWANLSPEEREKIREHMRAHHCRRER
jgi:hypothetical protein